MGWKHQVGLREGMQMKDKNITYVDHVVNRADRSKRYGHKSALLWFTGLSGSGKSTVSQALNEFLFEQKIQSYVLDGDNIRHGLNSDLGFSAEDRKENIRRIAEVGKLFVDAGMIVTTAFISPYREDRERARAILEKGNFIEVYIKCSLEMCEKRDPKGLYKKARAGEIANFTGITDPYEEPENPELIIDTSEKSIEQSVQQIFEYLRKQGIIL